MLELEVSMGGARVASWHGWLGLSWYLLGMSLSRMAYRGAVGMLDIGRGAGV